MKLSIWEGWVRKTDHPGSSGLTAEITFLERAAFPQILQLTTGCGFMKRHQDGADGRGSGSQRLSSPAHRVGCTFMYVGSLLVPGRVQRGSMNHIWTEMSLEWTPDGGCGSQSQLGGGVSFKMWQQTAKW